MTADRRTTPATDRTALEVLRGVLDRPAWTAGRPAGVAVPVADLCAAVDGARDRQVLFGTPLTVIEERGGWTFVQSGRDGYCGWLPSGAVGPALATTHRVAAPATHVYAEADIKRGEVMSLSLGARVGVAAAEGRFARLATGGFVPLVHLADSLAADPVAVAESLLGTPYLWGGNSRAGIDCSGLVQAALEACGIPSPGDSDQQWQALGEEVPMDGLRRGDLIFWRGHVAMVRDADSIIHANGHSMSVAIEGLRAALDRIAGAGEGALLGARRVTAG